MNIEKLIAIEILKSQNMKNGIKTIGEFKKLGKEFRDKFGLTAREATDLCFAFHCIISQYEKGE